MRRLALPLLFVVALAAAPSTAAHTGGKAEPRIAAGLSKGDGLVHVLTVRLTDLDTGEPVTGATVSATAEMVDPHLMRLAPWQLPEGKPGIYRARVQFVMPGNWEATISASGTNVVSATSRLPVEIEARAAPLGPPISAPPLIGAPSPASVGEQAADIAVLPTRLEDDIGRRDALSMAVLWLHGVSALGWIVGVLVMAVALSTPPGVLTEGFRSRVSGWYRGWGAWLHWGFVPLIVWTGIYNMIYVTPFSLVWRPSQLDDLADIPYGPLYEALLVVKLALFAGLLITGTHVLIRTLRKEPATGPANGSLAGTLASALGPPGIFYLASVPLILAAAMSLRYIHVLSHVATVIAGG